jgi:hypothetical protein
MVDRFETMTCDSEQIMYRAEDREEALSLLHGFEAAHPASSLTGVLVGEGSLVFPDVTRHQEVQSVQ